MSFAGGLILAIGILWGGGAYVARVSRDLGRVLPPSVRAAASTKTARPRVAARQAVQAIWAQAKADDWLERRRSKRDKEPEQPPAGASPKPARASESLIRQSLARVAGRKQNPQPAPQQPAGPAAVASVTPINPMSRAAPAPSQPATPQPNGRTPAMTTPIPAPSGAAADLFTAVHQIIGHANAGGVQAKLRAIVALTEAHELLSAALVKFGQQLAEPGAGYGAPIWEPLVAMGSHDKAAAMAGAESASALQALMQMTVGELSASPVRAPHHNELNASA